MIEGIIDDMDIDCLGKKEVGENIARIVGAKEEEQ